MTMNRTVSKLSIIWHTVINAGGGVCMKIKLLGIDLAKVVDSMTPTVEIDVGVRLRLIGTFGRCIAGEKWNYYLLINGVF